MATLRAALIVILLAVTTLIMLPVQWIALKLKWRASSRLPRLWHAIALKLVGVRVTQVGKPSLNRPLLITANHTSWLDISVIGSRLPLSFIAKSEVAGWPVFGLLAKLQRTVFVDRRRRTDTGRVAAEIGDRLGGGDAMVLFAEGTSNDGNGVLPFRSALIGAAQHALAGTHETVYIQPLSIAYLRLHGLPMGRRLRPHVAWYGDMELAGHLWSVFQQGALDVQLTWGEPILVEAGADRKLLTKRLETSVVQMTAAALCGREPAPSAADGVKDSDVVSPQLFSSEKKAGKADATLK